ncbi:nitrogenase molybdenum-iron protein alpha chain, partial [Rhizobium johnstonii]
QDKAEALINRYQTLVQAMKEKYRPHLIGNTVLLSVGGLRHRHVITAYEDFGMELIGTGYEFGRVGAYERTGPPVKT